MGWLRLHRLWGAEAAINQAMLLNAVVPLKGQMTRCLLPGKISSSPDVLKQERRILDSLACDVDDWIVLNLPSRGKNNGQSQRLKAKQQLLDYINEASDKYRPMPYWVLTPMSRMAV